MTCDSFDSLAARIEDIKRALEIVEYSNCALARDARAALAELVERAELPCPFCGSTRLAALSSPETPE